MSLLGSQVEWRIATPGYTFRGLINRLDTITKTAVVVKCGLRYAAKCGVVGHHFLSYYEPHQQPTLGTLTVFQLLAPLLTNNGEWHRPHNYATGALLLSCALSYAFSTFTDSFTGADGKASYGIDTMKGLYVFADVAIAALISPLTG